MMSVVGGGSRLPPAYGLVQAWSVDSLQHNLARQRRTTAEFFLPVVAFRADPEWFKHRFGLPRLPQDVWLGWLVQFRDVPIDPEALRPILGHYAWLPDGGADLFGRWLLEIEFGDLTHPTGRHRGLDPVVEDVESLGVG